MKNITVILVLAMCLQFLGKATAMEKLSSKLALPPAWKLTGARNLDGIQSVCFLLKESDKEIRLGVSLYSKPGTANLKILEKLVAGNPHDLSPQEINSFRAMHRALIWSEIVAGTPLALRKRLGESYSAGINDLNGVRKFAIRTEKHIGKTWVCTEEQLIAKVCDRETRMRAANYSEMTFYGVSALSEIREAKLSNEGDSLTDLKAHTDTVLRAVSW